MKNSTLRSIALAASAALSLSAAAETTELPAPEAAWTEKMSGFLSEGALPARPSGSKKVLVFYRTEGYCHRDGIRAANEAIRLAAVEAKAWTADFSYDYADLAPENLAKYDALVLNNTTNLKTGQHRHVAPAIVEFVKRGKGLAAIHAGDDGFGDDPEVLYMIGGHFTGHPWGAGGTWRFSVDDADSPLTAMFDRAGFSVSDEIYLQESPYCDLRSQHVLLSLDLSDAKTREALDRSEARRRADGRYPVAWTKRFGRGRVFYSSFGHDHRAWLERKTFSHLLGGVQFAVRDLESATSPTERPMVAPESR